MDDRLDGPERSGWVNLPDGRLVWRSIHVEDDGSTSVVEVEA